MRARPGVLREQFFASLDTVLPRPIRKTVLLL
jgi:hypothetical protein